LYICLTFKKTTSDSSKLLLQQCTIYCQ